MDGTVPIFDHFWLLDWPGQIVRFCVLKTYLCACRPAPAPRNTPHLPRVPTTKEAQADTTMKYSNRAVPRNPVKKPSPSISWKIARFLKNSLRIL